jgi:LPS export ABC transporter protein LptC
MAIGIRFFIALFAAAILLVSCGEKTVSEGDSSDGADSVIKPDSEVFGATVYLYEGNRITTEIRADKIVRYEPIDSTMAYVLDVDFFDSLGQKTSNLVGDSGVIRENTNQLEVYGHVVVITEDSARLDTEYLKWNPKREKIESDAYVKFTRNDDIMTGWGMEADPDLGRLRIKSQVSGSVTRENAESDK